MTWFRVDDTLCGHSKPRRAGLAALGLWTVAGSWCGDQLSDGQVPAWFVASWPAGRRLAAGLVLARLWHEAGHDCGQCPQPVDDHGWVFHDWHQCNPTRAAELDKRAKRAAAGRLGGLKSGHSRASKPEANASASATRIVEPRPGPTQRTNSYVPAPVTETHAREDPHGQPGRIEALLQEHVQAVGKVNPRAMTELGGHLAELCRAGYTDEEIRAGFVLWRKTGVRPSSLPDQVDYARRNGARIPNGRAGSTTNDRVQQALDAGARVQALADSGQLDQHQPRRMIQ